MPCIPAGQPNGQQSLDGDTMLGLSFVPAAATLPVNQEFAQPPSHRLNTDRETNQKSRD